VNFVSFHLIFFPKREEKNKSCECCQISFLGKERILDVVVMVSHPFFDWFPWFLSFFVILFLIAVAQFVEKEAD